MTWDHIYQHLLREMEPHWIAQGPCEMCGEEVSGLFIWARARDMAAGEADDIVLSEAIHQALADDTPPLQDRGMHTVKDSVPGDWQLHSVSIPSRTRLVCRFLSW